MKKIYDQLAELEKQKRELEKSEYRAFVYKVQNLVGKCFKRNNRLYKIIDVPQEKWDIGDHYTYNPYQFPAIMLFSDVGDGFFYSVDTLYIRDFNNIEYEEISSEEFAKRWEELAKSFAEKYLKEK